MGGLRSQIVAQIYLNKLGVVVIPNAMEIRAARRLRSRLAHALSMRHSGRGMNSAMSPGTFPK
jgi:hypothetical protein